MIAILLLLLGLGPAAAFETDRVDHASVCFTLAGDDCALAVVAEIAKAERTLQVHAYNFTEPRIIAAIIAAKRRGVAVAVILDKISPTQKGEGADPVNDAGIPVWIDRKPKIAHNKVMIIDGAVVLTGSFNFSTNATAANAENMIVLRSPELAESYAENFRRRLALSQPYHRAPPITATLSKR